MDRKSQALALKLLRRFVRVNREDDTRLFRVKHAQAIADTLRFLKSQKK